jgi:steroid 5-alpha reductase family enzyme
MLDFTAYSLALMVVALLALGFWIFSLIRDDVSIVDSLWSIMFLVLLAAYLVFTEQVGPRKWLLLALVSVWAVRLSAYISLRNHGKPEDHRYQAIRKNNEPNFGLKSLYIVFGLQAALAGIIAIPLLTAVSGMQTLGVLDMLGVLLWITGMFFEVVGDAQLARFRAEPSSDGAVLDHGLWRYTRHPNYFGEFTLWWGYYCFAVAAGGWWTIFAPLLMSVLLLRVSGVTLLESDIGDRRPGYAHYVNRTNAFFPGPPRTTDNSGAAK